MNMMVPSQPSQMVVSRAEENRSLHLQNRVQSRNPYESKCHVLFSNFPPEWMTYQPNLGVMVYVCYSCRDIFKLLVSFKDHVNRRCLLINYSCPVCYEHLTFYNPCSFLIHVTGHFPRTGGTLDLDTVHISTLPIDFIGFLPHPEVPLLYDYPSVDVSDVPYESVRFFKPLEHTMVKQIVSFEPNSLMFFYSLFNPITNRKETSTLILKPVSSLIPLCKFVDITDGITEETSTGANNDTAAKENRATNSTSDTSHTSDSLSDVIKIESTSDEETEPKTPNLPPAAKTPVIMQPKVVLKNINELLTSPPASSDESSQDSVPERVPKCPECKKVQRMAMVDHFQVQNRPLDETLKCPQCSLLSPSQCSLQAHIRIHSRSAPFICPECGIGYDSFAKLTQHMEDVCFHLAKVVRYKCPGKKCGKIFAQSLTFSTHFSTTHYVASFRCDVCHDFFDLERDCKDHSIVLHGEAEVSKCHMCVLCRDAGEVVNLNEHTFLHVHDPANRVYIYVCRFCKSLYRSKQTYAAHMLKCSKLTNVQSTVKPAVKPSVVEESPGYKQCNVYKYCAHCKSRIRFQCSFKDISRISSACPKCHRPYSSNLEQSRTAEPRSCSSPVDTEQSLLTIRDIKQETDLEESDQLTCKHCNQQFSSLEGHACQTSNTNVENAVVNNSQADSAMESSVLIDSSPNDKFGSPNSDDSQSRKRKLYRFNTKQKKPLIEISDDIRPEGPIVFDGEYKCRICSAFNTTDREKFHAHIREHRSIPTAYQCMECGEYFVVKPPLVTHLQVFHSISDVNAYMESNECYDKEAMKDEAEEPTAENQCRICRQFFESADEVSKHFRVHGMAFLMKNKSDSS